MPASAEHEAELGVRDHGRARVAFRPLVSTQLPHSLGGKARSFYEESLC